MEELLLFIADYGWQLTLIAILGIVILGALKYLNVFSNIQKAKRKPLYFMISVGFSFLATVIYLAVMDKFEVEYIAGITGAIYGLNQIFYSIYETTTLRELVNKLFAILVEAIKQQHNKTNEGGQ